MLISEELAQGASRPLKAVWVNYSRTEWKADLTERPIQRQGVTNVLSDYSDPITRAVTLRCSRT